MNFRPMTDGTAIRKCCGNVMRATTRHFQCLVCRRWYNAEGRKVGYGSFREMIRMHRMRGVDIDAVHRNPRWKKIKQAA